MIAGRQFWITLFLCGLAACTNTDDAVFGGDDNVEIKPEPSLLASKGAGAQADVKAKNQPVATVKYRINASTKSGANLCKGEATIQIMGDFDLKFPESYVNCVSLKINLSGLLSGRTSSQDNTDRKLEHDGMVLSIGNLADATFDPPRPVLLGPLVQQEGKYKGFSRTTEHTLTAKDANGAPVKGRGSFSVEVLDDETTYKDPGATNISFDKVMHWEIKSNFDTPAKYGLTFQKWTWYWNTRPVMIPGIVIEGGLGDFIEGDSADLAALLVGDIKLELYVQEYEIQQ